MTTAIDPRIKVAAPLIAMQGFKWELDNNLWMRRVNSFQKAFDKVVKQEGINNPTSAFVAKFYDRVVPGIYGEFDGPALIKLIAPGRCSSATAAAMASPPSPAWSSASRSRRRPMRKTMRRIVSSISLKTPTSTWSRRRPSRRSSTGLRGG
jgi:hypothetical protein